MAEGPEEQQRRIRREPPPGEDRPEIRRRLSSERDELNPDPTSTDDEMEALRLDIARTRAEMSESVYALQERMNPQYIRQQATSQLRQGASDRAKGASSGVTDTIRNNPVPAALTGAGLVGLGWLIASGASGSSGDDDDERSGYSDYRYGGRSGGRGGYRREGSYYDLDDPDYTPEYTYSGSRELEGYRYDDDDDSESRTGQAQERAGQAGQQARERAGQAGQQARERAGQAGQQARERAQQARGEAQQRAQQAKGGFQRALQESPLSLGAIALGIGAAVGFAIPESSKENELMGETRDQLANQAQQRADDATQRAQRVAKQARETAEEEASRQDLKE